MRTRCAAVLFEALAITFPCNCQFRLLLQRLSCTTRALAGAGVRARALAAQGQALAMAYAAIAAEVHQALDVHRHFTAKIAFDDKLADFLTQLFEVCVGQIFDLLVERDTSCGADIARTRAADAIDRGQTDFGVLVVRDVNPCDTSHCFSSNKKRRQKCACLNQP
ncbi:protein of unknown function [Paraburkholderia kururiensis]